MNFSKAGYPIGTIETNAYWAIELVNGTWACEMDYQWSGGPRLDWTLDICSTSDWKRIKSLEMYTPTGLVAHHDITEPGTAFQFKVGVMDSNVAASMRRQLGQVIGKVTDPVSGDCLCYVFDYGSMQLIEWNTNIHDMGKWRPDVVGQPQMAPIVNLSFDVVGIHL